MKLFHVQADDPMGENLDWFIVAKHHNEALSLWQHHTEENGFDNEEGVTRIREILPTVVGTRFDGGARAIPWEDLTIVFEP